MVGGGVVGLTIAHRLARDGLSVALFERTLCGREASWAGAGIITPCNPHRDDPLFQLQERSIDLFPELCASIQSETGIDPQYRRCGELQLLLTDNAVSIARSDERAAKNRTTSDGQPLYEWLSTDETRRLEPALSNDVLGSLLCRQTAQVRNSRLLRALHEACIAGGVEIRENTPVDALLVEGSRVTGVRAGDATAVSDQTVICAGAWSSQIGSRLHTLMPVHPVRGQIVLMKLDTPPFDHIVTCGKHYLVPRRDGHVLLGSTEEPEAGFQKRNTAKGIAALIEAALRMVPVLADAPIQATWSGLRPGTPDNRPYIGAVPGLGGLIAATGHFRAGLTLAPATAEAIAATVQHRTYDIDLTCCRPGRS